jgi:hypothetical protein
MAGMMGATINKEEMGLAAPMEPLMIEVNETGMGQGLWVEIAPNVEPSA